MKKKFGTPDVSELIDESIYLFLKEELSDPLIEILNDWVETKGNTIKFYWRIKHWEQIIALELAELISNN
jgi:hypothetical protein